MTIENDEAAPAADDQIQESTSTETPASDTNDAPASVETAESSNEPTKSLLDVLSESVEEASKPRRLTPKAEELKTDDSRPRNADGTFKTETKEEIEAREALANETPEAKAAREAKEAEAAKKPADHINDPIPENLNKRTGERIKSLIETVKAQELLVNQHHELFSAIQNTGASPDEFATMINYMRGARSGNPKDMEYAYGVLQSELRGLAVKMGKPLYEVNLLRDKENADLVSEIAEGKITSNRAHEIALMREAQKSGRQQTAKVAETTTAANAEAQAAKDFDKLDAELRARDGDAVFQAKFDILVPALKGTLSRLAPADRLSVFKDAYANLKMPAQVAAPAPVQKTMPQRPKSPAGGTNVSTAPKSAMDAINAALGM